MNYEQKYKESMLIAEHHVMNGALSQDEAEALFPELAESEDERIRMILIDSFEHANCSEIDKLVNCRLNPADILAWLKKQKEQNVVPSRETILGIWELGNFWKENPEERDGLTQLQYIQKYWFEKCDYQKEQKPADADYISGIREELLEIEDNAKNIDGLTESQWVAIRAAHRLLGEYIEKEQRSVEWNEEDELMAISIIDVLKQFEHRGAADMKIDWLENRLKSLRPHPQMLEDWTSEDDELLADVLGCITLVQAYKAYGDFKEFKMGHTGEELRSFVRSLKSRPRKQPHWKPSEEQMGALLNAEYLARANNYPENAKILANLYEQLKAL